MSKKLILRSSIFLIILLGIYIGIAWSLSNLILFPEQATLEKSKSRIANGWGTTYEAIVSTLPTPENFEVNSDDGLTIRGKYFKQSDTSDCAIIYVHGWNSTWAGMLKYRPLFEDCGCDAIFYDHRMHGESDDKYATGGIMEKRDLIKVTTWTEEKTGLSQNQIGWVGASWGGATVLQAGALKEKEMAFILSDAPFQDWYNAIFERAIRSNGSWIYAFTSTVLKIVNWRADIDYREASALNAASDIKSPVFLIHSKGDNATLSFQSENIAKNLNPQNSVFHHTAWGNDHTGDVIHNTDDFRQLTLEFLKKSVPNFNGCQ